MNKTEISIRKLQGIVIPITSRETIRHDGFKNKQLIATINAEMIRLGFIMTETLFDAIDVLSQKQIEKIVLELIPVLKELKGDDVKYEPMYPNFPKQVIEASDLELFLNAICHYWSLGTWKPEYVKEARQFNLENVKLREIDIISEEVFEDIFTIILSSNDSISSLDKEILNWFFNSYNKLIYPEIIPYKENMCYVAGERIKAGKQIDHLVKTSTDILRVITYLSGGDISLATNTKFKSLPRLQRRYFIRLIEKNISEEDIQRHRNKWNKLFHNLHVGEYSDKVLKIANKVRNNKRLETTAGKVQELINQRKFVKAAKILENRPGEFARKLDLLLRKEELDSDILSILFSFEKAAPNISTRVLLQLLGHFNGRSVLRKRVIFPKGNIQKARLIEPIKESLGREYRLSIIAKITNVLTERFAKFGKIIEGDIDFDENPTIWIDEMLKDCPLPVQQRSASDALDTYARGTRIPVTDDKGTIRLFIYWVGNDIDLSATFYDENFEKLNHISYTNLRDSDGEVTSCHSGDIVQAPHGASEFIDVNIEKALAKGYRYVVMNVLVFSGENFKDHKKVYVGWMTRDEVQSGEIYDPKTVENKLDLKMESKNAIPVIFDLLERKVIITDLVTPISTYCYGNNVESNKASIGQVLESMLSLHNKTTLYELFKIHANARGQIVEDRAEANFVFGNDDDADVTPKDINLINSEFIK